MKLPSSLKAKLCKCGIEPSLSMVSFDSPLNPGFAEVVFKLRCPKCGLHATAMPCSISSVSYYNNRLDEYIENSSIVKIWNEMVV